MASPIDWLAAAAFVGAPVLGAFVALRIQTSIKQLRRERQEFEDRQTSAQKELEEKKIRLQDLKTQNEKTLRQIHEMTGSFAESYLTGRQWLCRFVAEIKAEKLRLNEAALLMARRPAIKAAEAVKVARAEVKALKEQELFLRYELETIKEYFPFLATFEQEILEDKIKPSNDRQDIEENYDRARDYLSADEYARLADAERSQLALDRYKNRPLSNSQIGKFYERYLGYIYESKGFEVEYFGIEQGLEDMGRDLICKQLLGHTVIVQAKCWSRQKTIHEKHIYQLFGTVTTYNIEHPDEIATGALYTTTALSDVAREAARRLGIDVHENFALDKGYPMIKCNIGKGGQKLYHLPFDQQYDRTRIDSQGERYVATVDEAVRLGFTRAKRHAFKS